MKYLKEYNTFTTIEEEIINNLLDKGLSNLSDEEFDIVK